MTTELVDSQRCSPSIMLDAMDVQTIRPILRYQRILRSAPLMYPLHGPNDAHESWIVGPTVY